MKIYFNGCSHTYGDDLPNPSTQSWPAVLCSRRGYDFVNDSVSGGTNERIMYRTVKLIDGFDKFYIAWTYTNRFTRYRADNNHEVNFNIGFSNDDHRRSREFVDYALLHYRYWHNELFAFKLWLQQILLLQNLFEQAGKEYVMINTANNHINRWCVGREQFKNSVKSLIRFELMDDKQIDDEYLEIQQLLTKINLTKFIGWNRWCITDMMSQYPLGRTGHLLTEGHIAIAEHILKHDTN